LDRKEDLTAHNYAYTTLGMFILWVGFFFFNGASGLDMFGPRRNGPSKIIFNTAISSAFSGMVAVFLKPYTYKKFMKVN
jgi:ammonia channel protein AmtB